MIFIDTGAFLANCLSRDQHAPQAREAWEELAGSGESLLTSSMVLTEFGNLVTQRVDGRFAAVQLHNIYDSPRLRVLRPVESDEREALAVLEKFADQRLSFTDAVSFVLMQRLRVRRAFTFDRHFELAGFDRWPAPDWRRRER